MISRWPMVELLDLLKETDLRVHFTDRFKSPTAREQLDRATLQRRLLLCLYGLGTNIGLKRVAAGSHGENYRDLLYTCSRYLSKDALRAAITDIVNAIAQIQLAHIWDEGTTACASDSKKYPAWDQNLMTELLNFGLSVRKIATLLNYPNHHSLNTYVNKRGLRHRPSGSA